MDVEARLSFGLAPPSAAWKRVGNAEAQALPRPAGAAAVGVVLVCLAGRALL